tara:strand:- start:6954 stop:7622 length:669 start_codon:yes stop_codon:yes gene_type:complete
MSKKIFSTDPAPEEIPEKQESIVTPEPEPEPQKKKGKHRKEMTPQRKAQLVEQLKSARLASQAKRGAKAKEKKLQKLKEIESEVENNMIANIEKKVLEKVNSIRQPKPQPPKPQPPTEHNEPPKPTITATTTETTTETETIETKIEKRLRLKLEKEYENSYSHKLKDYQIKTLEERLSDYKQTKIKPLETEQPKQIKPKIQDTISPLKSRNLMDKYRKIRGF